MVGARVQGSGQEELLIKIFIPSVKMSEFSGPVV